MWLSFQTVIIVSVRTERLEYSDTVHNHDSGAEQLFILQNTYTYGIPPAEYQCVAECSPQCIGAIGN